MALLTPYEPWSLLDRFEREMERSLESMRRLIRPEEETAAAVWAPSIDIKEEADRYVVQADLPGVKPEDIEVTLQNGVLTIKGERQTEAKEEKENYRRIERFYGSFFRRFTLPETVEEEKIEANYDKGVLTISIPKKPEVQPKKISVKVA
ncbi:MAG: Hsp20/alpha crystallin family protein [Methylohalobius sp.]|nr:Hsp20/alpha crystallin family protein [Methylohalobius sp.]